jgi:hypothetical protein
MKSTSSSSLPNTVTQSTTLTPTSLAWIEATPDITAVDTSGDTFDVSPLPIGFALPALEEQSAPLTETSAGTGSLGKAAPAMFAPMTALALPPGAVLTNDPAPTLIGTATVGTTVTVRFDDGTTVGTTAVDANGNWSYRLPELSDGAHTFLVTAQNEAGTFKTTGITLVIDTTPPSALVAISAIHEDTGVSATDFITKDTTLLVDAKIVSGTLGEDERVQISLDGGKTWHETTALGGGMYQFDAQDTPLQDGIYHFQARAIDLAGNAGQALDQVVVIKTTPPPDTTIQYIDSVGPLQGIFGTGTTTDDSKPVLTGTLSGNVSPGDTVGIYEGARFLGEAVVNGQNWTFDLGKLGRLANDTTHTYTAAVTDLAGNGSTSASLTLTEHAPVIINSQTVIIDSKSKCQDMDWVGKAAASTLAATPLVSGVLPFKLENGEYMEVKINNLTYSSKTGAVNVNLANDGWSVQIPAASTSTLKLGTYDVVALIKSADGSVLSQADTKNELTIQENQYWNECHEDWWKFKPDHSHASFPMVTVPATTPKGSDYTFTDSSKGGNTIQGAGGNDTFNLTSGAHDTLLFRLLDKTDATGGNGSDQVNGFIVGSWGEKSKADRIDLSELLIGYRPKSSSGPAHFVKGVAAIDAGDKIADYLSVTHSGGNTIVNIDRDGNGGQFSSTALVTLNGVSTDLATLLANHQIVVDHHG